MVLPNAGRFARTAGLGTKLKRHRLRMRHFQCAAEVTQNETFRQVLNIPGSRECGGEDPIALAQARPARRWTVHAVNDKPGPLVI
jgi:hypothetical protein